MEQFDLKAFLDDLKTICAIDSGKHNAPGTNAMAAFFEERFRSLGLKTQILRYQDNEFAPFLLASNSDDEDIDVIFVAHMDTVFPVGTGEEWPFTVDENGIGHGPGCVDCKGGCLLVWYLLRAMQKDGGWNFRFRVAFNSDEETLSGYSRPYFEELARHAKYCLVFEPGRAKEEFVHHRKGGPSLRIKCHGVPAHSGAEPEKGANAIVELARWAAELSALNDYAAGTTVNISRFHGESKNGAIPDLAEMSVGARFMSADARVGLDAVLERMKTAPFDPRTSLEIELVSDRPAMEPHAATQALLEQLYAVGEEVGQEILCIATGGASDGNFIAPFGVATLDGCGPCGASLHTRDEFLLTASVERRFVLMRRLLERLFPQ